MKTIFLFIVILLTALLFYGCTTKPQKCTILGNVVLMNDTGNPDYDPVDFSGVTYAIYELAELDTTLVRVNREYPLIGSQICQETEFDHRNAIPLKSSVTGADGSFEIDGIDSGEYNVVLMKEQWGIKYLYGIEVQDSEEINIGEIELFPAITFSGSELDHVTFRSDHTYIIDGIVNFIGPVTFEPRTSIYGNQGTSIRFYGNVITPAKQDILNAWKLLSSKDMYLASHSMISPDDYMSSVVLYEESPDIRNGVIQHLSNGISLNGTNCTISNLMIRYCGTGFSIPQGSINVDNLVIGEFTDNMTNYGIQIQSDSNGQSQISESVFMKLRQGIVMTSLNTLQFTNCYCYENYRALLFNCAGSVINNAFELNEFDINRSSSAYITDISYNNFYHTKRTSIRPIGRVTANYNNFYSTDEFFINIYSNELPGNSTVPEDLDATNNYWGVSDVDDFLYDALDNQDHPDEPCEFYIDYTPRRSSPVANAGIQ